MLLYNEAELSLLATHYVGNKALEETMVLSKKMVDIDDENLKQTLLQYFLGPFAEAEAYAFTHATDLGLNEVMHFATAIFEDPNTLLANSIKLARQLYDSSAMPNIKSGELHVAYFNRCIIDGKVADAIGIYKSESKDTFLKVEQAQTTFKIERQEGVNINKLDKGCLIFNINKENGYHVCVIDKTNRGEEARFWKDTFLQLKQLNDSFHSTNDYLKLCKNYILDQVPADFEATKVEQINFLNKSVDFFKKNERFDKERFEKEVFEIPEVIESFRSYERNYLEGSGLDISDSFDISANAVKKQSRVFRSVIKLDKNFHVYVHGNKDLIERGYDAAVGKHYYKIYFDEES